LLWFWLGGQLVSAVLHVLPFRDADVRAVLRTPIGWRELAQRARRGPLIYLNDIAAAGQVYIDRFVIGAILGVSAAGLYTLYFSLTHGLYVLVATASVQMAMPRISETFRREGAAALPGVILREVRRATAIAGILAIVITLTALLILPWLGFAVFAANRPLFVLMVAASFIKPVVDVLNTSLYAIGLDRQLASVNLVGVAVSVITGALLTATIGLIGFGISAILTQIAMLALNFVIISRFVRQQSGRRRP
jgi:O-antigen/teichoic acid export membrane protein